MTEVPAGQPCSQCSHPFDSHAMVALYDSAMDGGVVMCPVRDCQCQSTWSPKGVARPELPPQHELDQIRAVVQNGTIP